MGAVGIYSLGSCISLGEKFSRFGANFILGSHALCETRIWENWDKWIKDRDSLGNIMIHVKRCCERIFG